MINPSIHRYNKKNNIRHFGHIQHRIKIAGNSEESEPLLHLGETKIQLNTLHMGGLYVHTQGSLVRA